MLTLIASLALIASPQPRHGSISKQPFGKTNRAQHVELYTLKNGRGMTVKVMTYGATVTEIDVPDRNGKSGNVVLGFDSLADYEKNSPYFGATVGRFANRLAGGTFTIGGRRYQVVRNEKANTLHGGKLGYDKRVWKISPKETIEGPELVCRLRDPDGEQGFPGSVDVRVTYLLKRDNVLRIEYRATTDKPTPINLTNHSYFNLKDAGASSVKSHVMRVFARRYTPVDAALLPTGTLESVRGTPYDFLKPKPIGRDLQQTSGKVKGYDTNFVINGRSGFRRGAIVEDPDTGRQIEVYSTEPGLQIYTGNFLAGSFSGRGGVKYPQYSAFTLETQHFPDSPNHPNFPSTLLRPGHPFRSVTEYRFSAR